MGLQQLFAERPAKLGEHATERHVLEHLAYEREAVSVEAAGGQADQDVPGANVVRVAHEACLDHADDESREVVITERIHAGHLSGLAAQQRAAGLAARGGDASMTCANTS